MRRFTLFALLALPLVFAGCGSDDLTSPPQDIGTNISAADRAAIEADIAAQTDLFDDLTLEDPGATLLPYEEAGAALPADGEHEAAGPGHELVEVRIEPVRPGVGPPADLQAPLDHALADGLQELLVLGQVVGIEPDMIYPDLVLQLVQHALHAALADLAAVVLVRHAEGSKSGLQRR